MMAYRIQLECGDTSSLRSKKTPDGFTHDWEVYIRGVDNAPIHHYIEKVVFNLHETFHKPKRVIKEPPYTLKESGYAGFDIPIHIYLKNKNEPKRFEIMYNLILDIATPTISHHLLHSEIIVNPSEEFRKKLLKGGATPTSVDSSLEKNEAKTLAMVGKPKLSGNTEVKKHRIIAEPKNTDQFNDLFGPPIKTAKLTQESKKTSEKPSSSKPPAVPEKSDKADKSTKVKHSPHKDSKKEKSEERKEKREKEKDGIKDKEKSKDKSKRSSSPSSSKAVSHQSSDKRPSPSPTTTMKKPSSPVLVPKRPSSPSSKPKEKESKKDSEKEKSKDREKEKSKESSKSTSDEVKTEKSEKESKSERKKEKKKHKEDRDKEKKDKHRDKERERSKDKEGVKSSEKKVEKPEKVEKEKPESKPPKEDRKSPKIFKESEKVKEEKISKPEKPEKSEKEKSKEPKSEKPDKSSKHKHKKKDKKEKRDGSREREKKEKREKSKSSGELKAEATNHASTPTPVTTRVPEITDRDSSESSGDEDSVVESRLSGASAPKKELPPPAPPAEVLRTMSPPAPVADKKEKGERKRDRSKSRREEKESKKRKRKSESKGLGEDEVSPPKKGKDRDHSTSPLVEPVSSSQSPIATNADLLHSSKVKHTEDQAVSEPTTGDSEQVAPDSTNSTLADTEEPPLVFSEDYVLQLKDLQQKIMTLQDNQELQRVVQVIAETGQYEITKKTFDFDLCALDKRTVQRLQQFFAS